MDPAVCPGSSKSQLPLSSTACSQILIYSYLFLLFNLCCGLSLRPTTCPLSTFFLVIYIYIYFASSPEADGFGGVEEIKNGQQP